MIDSVLQVSANTSKMVLSSKSLFYKTENFMKQTKFMTSIDSLVSKLCEATLLNLDDVVANEKLEKNDVDCFSIETPDGQFSFLFKFGYQIECGLNDYDIVYFGVKNYKQNHSQTIEEYVGQSKTVDASIRKDKHLVKAQDFNRLYLISNVSNVNLPRLSTEQREIVDTVDKHILVQGVAGSGKTNICIDKIIFTACKNYTGKVLYTTFSRGLINDTKLKVEAYKKDLQAVLDSYNAGNIIFIDDNHKKALENRLGIYFFSDEDIESFKKIEKVLNYL